MTIKIPYVYSQEIVHNPKTLEMALEEAKHMPDAIFPIKAECLDPDYEYEWDRVQRMRREKDPLISGGRRRGF